MYELRRQPTSVGLAALSSDAAGGRTGLIQAETGTETAEAAAR
jgi:hypothetical protein